MCNLVIVLAFLPEAGREDVCSLMWSTCRPPRAISAEGTQPPPWGPTPDPPGAQGPCSPLGEGPFPSQRLSRARLGPVQSCCLQWLGTCPGGGGPLVQGQHFRMHSQLTGLSELFLPGRGELGLTPSLLERPGQLPGASSVTRGVEWGRPCLSSCYPLSPSGVVSTPHYARGQHKVVLKKQTGLFVDINASPLLQCDL